MNGFSFDEEKAVNVVLFILQKLGKVSRHQLAKILYYADQKHLVQYGRPILGDTYIRMDYGPVPSAVYDGIKAVNSPFGYELFKDSIKTSGKALILPKRAPEMDILSESEVKCIGESIDENKDLDFHQLIRKSHSSAWNSASPNGKISLKQIAIEGGADKNLLDHILDSIHDLDLSRQYGLIS